MVLERHALWLHDIFLMRMFSLGVELVCSVEGSLHYLPRFRDTVLLSFQFRVHDS